VNSAEVNLLIHSDKRPSPYVVSLISRQRGAKLIENKDQCTMQRDIFGEWAR
jgi:hypothetical protein